MREEAELEDHPGAKEDTMWCQGGHRRTFQSSDLGDQGANVSNGKPVHQALAPHEGAIVDDTLYPALPQDRQRAGSPGDAQSIPIVPGAPSPPSAIRPSTPPTPWLLLGA